MNSPTPRTPSLQRRASEHSDVVGVRFGYNPNSSSLGADLTALIWGSFVVGILAPTIGALARWLRRRPLDVVNPPPGSPASPPATRDEAKPS